MVVTYLDASCKRESWLAALRLGSAEPHNTWLQRNLAFGYWNIAGLTGINDSADARRAMLQKGLEILQGQHVHGQLPSSYENLIQTF
jgi:hypothetical protein